MILGNHKGCHISLSALLGQEILYLSCGICALENSAPLNWVYSYICCNHTIEQDKFSNTIANNLFLLITGTSDHGKNLITNINLPSPGQVSLKCNNAPPQNNISWKKVNFDQVVVSLDIKSDSFDSRISSLSETGKFICHNKNEIFHIFYIYPRGMLTLFTYLVSLFIIHKSHQNA